MIYRAVTEKAVIEKRTIKQRTIKQRTIEKNPYVNADDEAVEDRSHESGYVIAQTALLLIPLLIFAAFATDIGAWYVQSQKMQRAADAAALAGVVMMPDFAEAERVARETALQNGYGDDTPTTGADFDSGPGSQIRVTAPNSYSLEVEIRRAEEVYFAKLVMDDITLERYGVSQYIKPVFMGNPTSGLGTGTIPDAELGQPNDQMWLSVNAYCTDHEHGDPYLTGYYNGPNVTGMRACGPAPSATIGGAQPNPTYEPDAYRFAVEYAPSSPALDIDIYDPGIGCTTNADPAHTADGGFGTGTPIYYKVYGPNLTVNHNAYIDANAPFAEGFLPMLCKGDSPDGSGWWPLAEGLATPGGNGGFYYVVTSNRNTTNDPAGARWDDVGINNFSMRATKSGESTLCTYGPDPVCPQLYSLEHMPLYRDLSGPSRFYLALIEETHAGETLVVNFYDAAEGVNDLQFQDGSGTSMDFQWKYVDTDVGKLTVAPYIQDTAFRPADDCGGVPCLDTSVGDDFNGHFIEVQIEIPDDYTCGPPDGCWWGVRYNTSGNGTDRTEWSLRLLGDPVRLIE